MIGYTKFLIILLSLCFKPVFQKSASEYLDFVLLLLNKSLINLNPGHTLAKKKKVENISKVLQEIQYYEHFIRIYSIATNAKEYSKTCKVRLNLVCNLFIGLSPSYPWVCLPYPWVPHQWIQSIFNRKVFIKKSRWY